MCLSIRQRRTEIPLFCFLKKIKYSVHCPPGFTAPALYLLFNHCLYYIDNIVAQFLTFAYHIHIVDAILVLITLGVDILDIP